MAARSPPTRERILAAAGKLFQADGIHAVSVDAVAARAGVTKRTLYYHFRSKDELVAAHLAARDQPNLALFRRWYDETEGDAAAKVAGIFRNLADAARHPKWRGCGFLRTAAELVRLPGHPALVVGRAHKKRVEAWLADSFEAAGAGTGAAALARQVVVLLDGGFATVLLHRDPAYMEAAGEAAAALVRARLAATADA